MPKTPRKTTDDIHKANAEFWAEGRGPNLDQITMAAEAARQMKLAKDSAAAAANDKAAALKARDEKQAAHIANPKRQQGTDSRVKVRLAAERLMRERPDINTQEALADEIAKTVPLSSERLVIHLRALKIMVR